MSIKEQNNFNADVKPAVISKKKPATSSHIIDFKVSAEKRKLEKATQIIINRAARLSL